MSSFNSLLHKFFILAVFVLTIPLTLVAGNKPTSTQQNASTKQTNYVYYGAYVEYANPKQQNLSLLNAFEKDAGKGVAINQWFELWGGANSYTAFPATYMDLIRNHGSIPMITWEPRDSPVLPDIGYTLNDILSGKYDTYITKFALDAKSWGNPFFLRFAHEMNGTWYPWSEGVNGNTQKHEYVQMWRYVHDIFTKNGVTNVTWVWCPTAPTDLGSLQEYYPGDAYVDWTCFDGYNYGDTHWKSFSDIFSSTLTNLSKVTNKPVMISETASTEKGGNKAQWISDMLLTQLPSFPQIRAFLWFNSTIINTHDWYIESSPESQAAFSTDVQNSRYVGNQFALLSASPITPFSGMFSPTPSQAVTGTSTPTSTPIVSLTPTPVIFDTFNRPNQIFWGTATSGGRWGADANISSNYTIADNLGEITNNQQVASDAILGPKTKDAETLVQGEASFLSESVSASDSTATENSIGTVLRWNDKNDFYKASLGGMYLSVIKKVQGVRSVLVQVPFTAKPNIFYTIRFKISGNSLFAKTWQTGSIEPASWMIHTTDTSFVSGFGGIRTYLKNGANARYSAFSEQLF